MGSSVRQKSECASDMRWPNDIEVSPHESYLGSSECALRVYLGPLSSQGNRPSNFEYKQTNKQLKKNYRLINVVLKFLLKSLEFVLKMMAFKLISFQPGMKSNH